MRAISVSPSFCSGGRTADCRVLEVLRDHTECLTQHDQMGA